MKKIRNKLKFFEHFEAWEYNIMEPKDDQDNKSNHDEKLKKVEKNLENYSKSAHRESYCIESGKFAETNKDETNVVNSKEVDIHEQQSCSFKDRKDLHSSFNTPISQISYPKSIDHQESHNTGSFKDDVVKSNRSSQNFLEKTQSIEKISQKNKNTERVTTTITHIINKNPSFRLFTLESHYANKKRHKQALEIEKQQKAEKEKKKKATRLRREKFQKSKDNENDKQEKNSLKRENSSEQQNLLENSVTDQQAKREQQKKRNAEILSLTSDKLSNSSLPRASNIPNALSFKHAPTVSGLFYAAKSNKNSSLLPESAISSLIAIPNIIGNDPKARQNLDNITKVQQIQANLQDEPNEPSSPTKKDDENQEEVEKPKPHSGLEAGKKLPKKMGEFPKELFGKPIEELDEFYKDKNVSLLFNAELIV